MKIGTRDASQEIIVIAEIGNNHEGNLSVALELINRAAESGADAIKFQTFRTEHYVDKSVPERFERLKKFEFSPEQFHILKQAADKLKIPFLSTPFDLCSVQVLEPMVEAYKISSGDSTFEPLLIEIAKTQKPIILSTGLTSLAQIRRSIGLIQSFWQYLNCKQDIALLHCVSSYPVPISQANLSAIQTLKNNFPDLIIGYSDHTQGIEAALLAVALGAKIIEKHFTLAHDFSDFRDHQLSATPEEFKLLVEKIKQQSQMMGTGIKEIQPSEADNIHLVRRSIAAGKDLQAGTYLSWENLTWVRPGTGHPVGEEALFLGQCLNQDVSQGTLLKLEMVG